MLAEASRCAKILAAERFS